jgi:hypothetical protein
MGFTSPYHLVVVPKEAVVTVAAPDGLRPGAALLLGLSNGEVVRAAL